MVDMISDHFATIANALSPLYRLERLLQSGAAAYVFLAYESASGRRVAVKVLRDEMTATVDADRFMAEIGVVGRLRHPNIVPVLDSGDINGLPYYVMPFIEGETLRARLSRLGRLPLTDALWITEDIARALDFAHRHHVVHRDIKPENVMLDRGRALVLDFGIALALDALDAVESCRRTLPGLTLGTIHYMSPEQVDGTIEVDGRSDQYSLACLVYEMLCGRPPFTGTPNAVMRHHVVDRPRPLAAVCQAVPPRLGAALSRALQKAPHARYPTAGALVSAMVAGAPRLRVRGQCVAVVPFTNVTGEPAIDTVSDGVSEEIATALRDIDGLLVVPDVTVVDFEVECPIIRVAQRARADVVLMGDVRESHNGKDLLIASSLFHGRSGRRIWSDVVTAPNRCVLGELGSSTRHIAAAVADALGVARYGREARDVSSCRNTSPSRRISAP